MFYARCIESCESNIVTRKMKIYFTVAITAITICLFAENSFADSTAVMNIGVLAYRGINQSEVMWEPTANYLTEQITEVKFRIVPVSIDSAEQMLRDKQVHFIIANPALYAQLESKFGVSRIATLINYQLGKKFTEFGAVIFTHASRNDIFSLKDLANKSFMAVHEDAFGGWWMALRELQKHGLDPEKDFSRLSFSGFPHDDVVRAVKQGKVDAGTVRTGVLEHMALSGNINLSEFKILNPKLTPDFPFAHSTPLYPEWTIATTTFTPKNIAKKVVVALMKLESNSQVARSASSAGWTIPLDYLPVHELMKDLRVGPYRVDRSVNIYNFIQNHTVIITTILTALLAIAITILLRTRNIISSFRKAEEKNKKTVFSLNNELSRRNVHICRIVSLLNISLDNSLDPENKLQILLKKSCQYFGANLGLICEINLITKTYTVLNSYGTERNKVQNNSIFDLNNSFTGVTFTYNEPVFIEDVFDSDLKNHSSVIAGKLKSYMGIKIEKNGTASVTLEFLDFSTTGMKNENNIELLKVIGQCIGSILEHMHHDQLNSRKAAN